MSEDKKTKNPKLTQKWLAKEVVFSDLTIKKWRNDISRESPYNRIFT